MLDLRPSHLPLIGLGFYGGICSSVVLVGSFISKQFIFDSTNKTRKNKILLKELLEEFGLDIPLELLDEEKRGA